MSRIPIRRASLILLGLFLAGSLWWGGHRSSPVETPAIVPAGKPAAIAVTAGPAPASPPGKAAEPTLARETEAADEAENAVSAILGAPSPDNATTAVRLSALVLDSRRTAEQRAEALSHVLNLSVGHEAEVLLPLVRDAKLSADDCRTILDDSLNQSLDWQSDVYLAALRSRSEPELRTFIREHLAFLTDGPDLGDKPDAWVEPLMQAAAKRPK